MAVTGNLTTVSNASLGGSVISILLKQKAALQKLFIDPILGSFGAQNPRAFLVNVPITTRMQEAFSYKAELTEHAVESGAILSDHVILHPIKLDLSFDVSNWDLNYAKQAQAGLEVLFLSRTPVDLLTEHKQLTNMIITSLQIDNSAPHWGKLNCQASFQQLKFVTLETVSFPSQKVAHKEQTGGPVTSKSAETSTNNGKQTAKKQSTLFQAFN